MEEKKFEKIAHLLDVHPSIVKLRTGEYRTNLLHLASKYGADVSLLHRMIEAGCSMDEKAVGGMLPIHYAALNNQCEHIKLYLTINRSLVNAVNDYNRTPLHCASNSDSRKAVVCLLEQPNVDVNIKDNVYGKTADQFSRSDDVRMLIEKRRERIVSTLTTSMRRPVYTLR